MQYEVGEEPPESGPDDEALSEGQWRAGLAQGDARDDIAEGGQGEQFGGKEREPGEGGGVEDHSATWWPAGGAGARRPDAAASRPRGLDAAESAIGGEAAAGFGGLETCGARGDGNVRVVGVDGK